MPRPRSAGSVVSGPMVVHPAGHPRTLSAPIGRLRSSAGVARECANDSCTMCRSVPSIHDPRPPWFPETSRRWSRCTARCSTWSSSPGTGHPSCDLLPSVDRCPGGIALTAVDERDRVLGGLLGAVDPAQHVHAMLRRHGGALGVRIIARPRPIRSWRATSGDRGRRYARGVVRMLARRLRRNDTSESPRHRGRPRSPRLGGGRRTGFGDGSPTRRVRRTAGRAAQRHEIVLVTPPDQAARAFYERLGWEIRR